MLSEDLSALAASLRHMATAGAVVTTDMVWDLAASAESMAGQARGLEGRPVPPEARLLEEDLGANVVPLRRFAGGDLA